MYAQSEWNLHESEYQAAPCSTGWGSPGQRDHCPCYIPISRDVRRTSHWGMVTSILQWHSHRVCVYILESRLMHRCRASNIYLSVAFATLSNKREWIICWFIMWQEIWLEVDIRHPPLHCCPWGVSISCRITGPVRVWIVPGFLPLWVSYCVWKLTCAWHGRENL